MIKHAFPLKWPSHLPVTPLQRQRADSGFSANINLSDALRFLEDELDSAEIKQATLYTDYQQITSERLRKKTSAATGASLYLKHLDREYAIACDRWQRVEHNIYALSLSIRSLSNMEKWGLADLETSLVGFSAKRDADNSPVRSSVPDFISEFGLSSSATLDDATAIYHRRAKMFANDEVELIKLNLAMDEIREYFANKNS